MSAYHTRVGIIKGWLMAKDAPDTILTIVDELAEEPPSPVSLINSVEEVTRQREARRNAQAAAEPAVTEGARKIVSDLAASAKETAIALGQPFEKLVPDGSGELEKKPRKPRKPSSPEVREKMSRLIKERQAILRAGKEARKMPPPVAQGNVEAPLKQSGAVTTS